MFSQFLVHYRRFVKKCTFLDNLRTATQEGNMENRQINPFFSSTVSALTVCNIHFCIWKYSKFIFMWSPLCSILVCKIPQFFGQKLPIQTAHHIFLESRHPEVTKNLYYVCPPAGAKNLCYVLSSRWSQKSILCFVHPLEPNSQFFSLQLMDYID